MNELKDYTIDFGFFFLKFCFTFYVLVLTVSFAIGKLNWVLHLCWNIIIEPLFSRFPFVLSSHVMLAEHKADALNEIAFASMELDENSI